MPLEKLKEIETEILKKHPNIEDKLRMYFEEEKEIERRNKEYENVRKRIEFVSKTGRERKQKEYADAGFFKRIILNQKPVFTETELEKELLSIVVYGIISDVSFAAIVMPPAPLPLRSLHR